DVDGDRGGDRDTAARGRRRRRGRGAAVARAAVRARRARRVRALAGDLAVDAARRRVGRVLVGRARRRRGRVIGRRRVLGRGDRDAAVRGDVTHHERLGGVVAVVQCERDADRGAGAGRIAGRGRV